MTSYAPCVVFARSCSSLGGGGAIIFDTHAFDIAMRLAHTDTIDIVMARATDTLDIIMSGAMQTLNVRLRVAEAQLILLRLVLGAQSRLLCFMSRTNPILQCVWPYTLDIATSGATAHT